METLLAAWEVHHDKEQTKQLAQQLDTKMAEQVELVENHLELIENMPLLLAGNDGVSVLYCLMGNRQFGATEICVYLGTSHCRT